MTIDEKKEMLMEWCNTHCCANCPLSVVNRSCFQCPEDIDLNYDIISRVKENAPTADPVNRPAHYTDGKIEVIEYIEDKKLGFCLGNAIKYISRAGKKNPDKEIEDLKKAKWYIERRIKELEEAR